MRGIALFLLVTMHVFLGVYMEEQHIITEPAFWSLYGALSLAIIFCVMAILEVLFFNTTTDKG